MVAGKRLTCTLRRTGKDLLVWVLPVTLFLLFQGHRRGLNIDPFRADTLEIEVVSGTFLGNSTRNFYGQDPPSRLDVLWKVWLGTGTTTISRKKGTVEWSGAGWTGQPLLIRENGELFIIQGAYDHHLRKIRASDGEVIWKYLFDDVVKGTASFYTDQGSHDSATRYIILQGSRLGSGQYLDTPTVPSYRAISYITGQELWRLNSKWTDSYSRDVDGSALIIADTGYIGLENSLFTLFSPKPEHASQRNGMLQPLIYKEQKLYTPEDVVRHRYNVVTESSPALLGNRIYITSGSGHVWGYNLDTDSLDWDFYIGSDMDGSPVVTADSCLLIPVEKQYIRGQGGVFKLDPSRPPAEAVVWYFPTGNDSLGSWEGGIIGSVAVNDLYRKENGRPLAAFSAIDGHLYVVDHSAVIPDSTVLGPDSATWHPVPEKVFSWKTGASISTPLLTDSLLIAAGYGGLYLFSYDSTGFTLLDRFISTFESTPVICDRRIFLASRDGFFYCFGEKW